MAIKPDVDLTATDDGELVPYPTWDAGFPAGLKVGDRFTRLKTIRGAAVRPSEEVVVNPSDFPGTVLVSGFGSSLHALTGDGMSYSAYALLIDMAARNPRYAPVREGA